MDGAVFVSQKSVGVRVLIHDSYGQVVDGISKKINAPLGPLEAEVKAWEEGVKFAREIGVYDFTLEGDSLVVFTALRGLSTPPAAVESVIRGVLMVCGGQIPLFSEIFSKKTLFRNYIWKYHFLWYSSFLNSTS